VELPDDEAARQQIPALKAALSADSRVQGVSSGPRPVAFDGKASLIRDENGHPADHMVNFANVDENYLDVLGIGLAAGRNFSAAGGADPTRSVLVNEAFVRWMGWKNAVGQVIRPSHDVKEHKRVVGVVKDFHYTSLHNPIEPILLYYQPTNPWTLLVRAAPRDLAAVQSAWSAVVPQHPFRYAFLDAEFDGQYRQEAKMMTLFTWFSALTLLIAGLGLFGLASFTMLQRTKEIGIRKVLGASVPNLIVLLSGNVVRLVGIANLIAWPVAYWGMAQWLQNYAYRVALTPWLFVLPALVVLAVALLTISYQTLRAARANPVQSLRSE